MIKYFKIFFICHVIKTKFCKASTHKKKVFITIFMISPCVCYLKIPTFSQFCQRPHWLVAINVSVMSCRCRIFCQPVLRVRFSSLRCRDIAPIGLSLRPWLTPLWCRDAVPLLLCLNSKIKNIGLLLLNSTNVKCQLRDILY